MNVLTVGHVTHDRYGDRLVAGGCAFFGARVHQALGARVRLVTTVGQDFACDAELDGIEVAAARSGHTTLFENRYPPGGLRVQYVGAKAPPVTPKSLPEGWRSADLVHLAPVMGELDLRSWIDAVTTPLIAIGIQGWIKTSEAGSTVVQTPWATDNELLRGVGAACVGEEDLVDQGDLLDRLRRTIPIVALTHGRNGCEIFDRGTTRHVGIFPGAKEVDPTGAGDAFAAGFFQGLARGLLAVEAARLGAAAASIVIEAEGGQSLARVIEAPARALRVAS